MRVPTRGVSRIKVVMEVDQCSLVKVPGSEQAVVAERRGQNGIRAMGVTGSRKGTRDMFILIANCLAGMGEFSRRESCCRGVRRQGFSSDR